MQVRKATLDDCPGIALAHVNAWRAAYADVMPAEFLSSLSIQTRESLWRETILAGSASVYVAIDEEAVLGFIAFGKSQDTGAPSDQLEIWAINLRKDAWGRGVGKALVDTAIGFARDKGAVTLTLWVLTANGRARRFYSKCGFDLEQRSSKIIEVGGVKLGEVRYIRCINAQF